MEQVAATPENGNDAGSAEGTGPAKSAVQKRIDKIIRQREELRQEIKGLNNDLRRSLELLGKYKSALRAARRQHGG